jgi:hypothetical protein
MKKKIIIISSLIVVIAIPVAVFLFLFFTQPLFASKVFELCKVIDLRENLPKGQFQKVSIVSVTPISGGKDYEQIIFEVPSDKIKEFEAGFRRCVRDAQPIKGAVGCIGSDLRILADKGKYFAKIVETDDRVIIYGGFFHRGLRSKELRKVFYDAGLEYTAGGTKEREKEVNEP